MNDVCSTLMQKPKISSFFFLLFHMIERKVYLSEMLLRADIHVFFSPVSGAIDTINGLFFVQVKRFL